MAPIDDAIADLKSQEGGEHFSYTEVAAKHNVVRSTLTRRYKAQTRPVQVKAAEQQKLSLQQELELVHYIGEITDRGLPPTREMVQNFASSVAYERVLEA